MPTLSNMISDSAFFGVIISLFAYGIGALFKQKLKWAIFNPLLIAIVMIMCFLSYFNIDYKTYASGASFLTWLLTPATVCLAVPLYEKLQLLKDDWRAISIGIISGVFTSALSIYAMALAFSFTHEQYVTLLPKSITTAIGIGITDELGGYTTLTVAAIIITGIIGNMFAEITCKIFRITDPVAIGVAIGTSSHAIGTAKAMQIGKTEGAISSLSIVVAGLLTVATASLMAKLL